MSRTERLLRLINRIHEVRSFTAQSMAAEFNVSYRTILRDLQELSALGVPLYSEPGRGGGYRLLKKASSPSETRLPELFRIVACPELLLAGPECQAPFTAVRMTQTVLPRLWQSLESDLVQWNDAFPPSRRIAASLARSRIFRYVAGIEVRRDQTLPEHWTLLVIPAREYAVYTHAGGAGREDTEQTYLRMSQRLRQKGLRFDPCAYSLEIFDSISPDLRDIWMPLYG